MPYVSPTASDLKTRFPAFNGVDNGIVTSALGEAARMVDQTWTEGDFALAQMLYACHVMTLDGQGATAEAGVLADLPPGMKRVKAGGSEMERFGSVSSGGDSDASGLLATSFGQRFARLLRLNMGGGALTA